MTMKSGALRPRLMSAVLPNKRGSANERSMTLRSRWMQQASDRKTGPLASLAVSLGFSIWTPLARYHGRGSNYQENLACLRHHPDYPVFRHAAAAFVPLQSGHSMADEWLTSNAPDGSLFQQKAGWEKITCPCLCALYMNGDLETSPEGWASEKQLMDALERSGLRDKFMAKTLSKIAKDGPVNIFELDGSAGEHSASSGIRDPKPDGGKFDEMWGAFAEGDRFTLTSLKDTVKHVQQGSNAARAPTAFCPLPSALTASPRQQARARSPERRQQVAQASARPRPPRRLRRRHGGERSFPHPLHPLSHS